MTKIKLTALPIIIFSAIVVLSSCDRDDIEPQSTFSKNGIVMSGANEVPANPSTATGTMDVSYSKLSKTLTYKVTWQNLTDSLRNMHIHGLAPAGFNAGVFQNIAIDANPPTTIYDSNISGKAVFAKSGSLTGSLYVDGIAIKEADLLNGLYYINIHNNGANPNGGTFSGGEIRGQIVFQ